MLDSLRHGRGQCSYPPLSKYREYDGEWVNDLFDGQQGRLIYRDGTEYKGGFHRGKENGQGEYTFLNGDKYEGEYLNGVRHGTGRFSYAEGNEKESYEG